MRRFTEIDAEVAARLERRRKHLRITQGELADAVGISYQQVHKYLRGVNRVSAGRLYQLARALNVPITYFFEGL